MTRKGFFPKIARQLKNCIIILFVLQLLYIMYGRWYNPPITITQAGSLFGGYGLQRNYEPHSNISPYLRLAVIASEDQTFPDHDGIDWDAIEEAAEYNKTHTNKHGGSTISQQTAKNYYLWQGKSYIRKGLEVYYTKMIEWTWSKQRILDAYVNIVEMGKGIFGAEAAAQQYFGKAAKNLTLKESALIAACLPNPKVWTLNPMHPRIAKRWPRILRQMNNIKNDSAIIVLIN